MSKTIGRRNFFKDTLLTASGLMLGSNIALAEKNESAVSEKQSEAAFNLMKEVMKYRKISAHEHVGLGSTTIEFQLNVADKLGIERLEVSLPVTNTASKATPEEFRKNNNFILEAMKKHPDRYLGSFFVNPVYGKESLEEINRCVGEGMIGLKLYHQVKINDPLLYPIIEKLIDLKMIILMHASDGIGIGGKRTRYGNVQPNISLPENFVEAAKRYPEAMFQYAHTAGGGDWESACKRIKDYPNIYVDTSGSNNEGSMIDYVLKYLGEDRMFFGTDGSYYQGVAVILSSNLSESQKKKVFFDNYNNILRKAGNNVD